MHILIIEDEKKIADAISEGLQQEYYNTTAAYTGEDGFFLASTQKFDLIILDLMLPGRDGIEVLKGLRKSKDDTPVLILTAKDGIDDRVLGLDSGADDYLVKPFAFAELLARIRALTRRGRSEQKLKMRIADLELDCVTRKVTRGSQDITITSKEYELLEYMMRNEDCLVSREMLARDVWKITERVTPIDNVIDVHINHLRNKIDAPFDSKLLQTKRGLGFILTAKGEDNE